VAFVLLPTSVSEKQIQKWLSETNLLNSFRIAGERYCSDDFSREPQIMKEKS
jgi:hypothetical protein